MLDNFICLLRMSVMSLYGNNLYHMSLKMPYFVNGNRLYRLSHLSQRSFAAA